MRKRGLFRGFDEEKKVLVGFFWKWGTWFIRSFWWGKWFGFEFFMRKKKFIFSFWGRQWFICVFLMRKITYSWRVLLRKRVYSWGLMNKMVYSFWWGKLFILVGFGIKRCLFFAFYEENGLFMCFWWGKWFILELSWGKRAWWGKLILGYFNEKNSLFLGVWLIK